MCDWGIKLMEQEARYGNDERFKLNEKFDDIDIDEGLMDEQQKVCHLLYLGTPFNKHMFIFNIFSLEGC